MIASFQHSFVFIKTRKVAGTSAEIVLDQWCGKEDIVGPLAAEDEILRHKLGGSPRNFSSNFEMEDAYRAAISTHRISSIESARAALRHEIEYKPHLSARHAKERLPELWSIAFKFTIDRHPYEKAVSMAWRRVYVQAAGDTKKFQSILEQIITNGDVRNYPLYLEKDKLLVDRVYRFEEFWSELATFGVQLGKTLPDPIPRAKSRYRLDSLPAEEILTRSQKARLRDQCAPEMELLGYKP